MAEVEIHALRSTEDWDRCAALLGNNFDFDPYLNPLYQRQVSRVAGQQGACWLILAEGPGGFCTIWRERRRPLHRCLTSHLTTLDWSAMALPALLRTEGSSPADSCQSMIRNGSRIASRTGTGIASLCKLSRSAAEELAAALAAERTPFARYRFNTRWRIRTSAGAEENLRQRSSKTRYNLRRSERLLADELGGQLRHDRLDGATDPEIRRVAVAELLRLQRDSTPDPERQQMLSAFYAPVIEEWFRRGCAELHLLRGGEKTVAAQLNLRVGDEAWVALMEQDRHYDRFSPGIILLLRQIDEAFRRGIPIIDLGGEGDEWKKPWATETEETFVITWPLGGLAGLLWRARFRPRRTAVP